MRQGWKKLIAVLLAAGMMLGLTLAVQAATTLNAVSDGKVTDSATVTIKEGLLVPAGTDITFHTYQILYALYDASSNELTYQLTNWAAEVLGSDADTAITSLTNPSGNDKIVGAGATEQNTLVNKLAAAPDKSTSEYTVQWAKGSEGTYTATLPVGAYLVTADALGLSFLNMMVSVDATAGEGNNWVIAPNDVVMKGREVSLEKKVNYGGEWMDASTAQIGDTLDYRITADVPRFPENATNHKFTVTDTPKNLGIDLSSVQVQGVVGDAGTVLAGGTNYTASLENGVLTVDFTNQYFDTFYNRVTGAYNYDSVVITYQAKLLGTAETGADANKNTAKLVYGKDPYVEASTGELTDETKVYTYAVDITKLGEEENGERPALMGAEFSVSRVAVGGAAGALSFTGENGTYKVAESAQTDGAVTAVVTAGEEGKLTLTGLGEGTYVIQETKAPSGYTLNRNTLTVTITAKKTGADEPEANINTATAEEKDGNGTVSGDARTWSNPVVTSASFAVSLADTQLPQLPGTGGIGTTIFTAAGILLMLIAVILVFVAKRKKSE